MDCLECGACCRAFGIIEADDYISENLVMRDQELGYRCMILQENGRCICQMPDNRCMIYYNRPTICRKMQPESYWCKWARKREGTEK
jgi:Fe-S-cluster containining protein